MLLNTKFKEILARSELGIVEQLQQWKRYTAVNVWLTYCWEVSKEKYHKRADDELHKQKPKNWSQMYKGYFMYNKHITEKRRKNVLPGA